MGIIQRQGIKQSLVTYLGIVIGTASTLWIYPLDLTNYGLAQFIINTALFFMPFASLGTITMIIRFFPTFKNEENEHNGYFSYLLLVLTVSLLLFFLISILLKEPILNGLEILKFDTKLITSYFKYIAIILVISTYTTMFSIYITNFKRIVIPSIINNLLFKLTLPLFVLLLFKTYIDQVSFLNLLVISYIVSFIAMLIYMKVLKLKITKINFAFLNKDLLRSIFNYQSISLVGAIGGIIAFRIDTIMVASYIGLASTGIYAIGLFISNVIEIPYKSIAQISSPIISESWEVNNTGEINRIYKSSSLILLIVGLFIFLCIWLNVDDILKLTSNYDKLIEGKNVILFLGLAKLVDMISSVNNQIIAYSKYYKFNLFSVIVLAGLNIYANSLLIPVYGISGAAMATLISLTIFNLLKIIFIQIKFKMFPLSVNTLFIMLIAGATYGILYFVPSFHPIVNIFFKGALIFLLFGIPVYLLRLSPQLNTSIKSIFMRIKSIRK